MRHFDPALLETLVAFAESGSLVAAARAVHRTPSAVTAQMQRLEAAVGTALFEASGRGRKLTAAGELLLHHARQVLSAHREAWLSVSGASADGTVALGITQDFAGGLLPALIRQFARTHPRVRVDLRVGRSNELERSMRTRELDVAVAIRQGEDEHEVAIFEDEMVWLSAADGLQDTNPREIPLALLDPPCRFRDAALQALTTAGRPHRIAATSSGVSGLAVALQAGIAVTVRTRRWLGQGIALAPRSLDLPPLRRCTFSVRVHPMAGGAAGRLAAMLSETLPRAFGAATAPSASSNAP